MPRVKVKDKVFHQKYGIGTVQSIDDKYVTVEFSVGEKKFSYPSSFGKYIFAVSNDDFVMKGNTLIKYSGNDTIISVPKEVTIIGDSAFRDAGIVSISFGDHVKKVNDEAFMGCNFLSSITELQGLESIGKRAFKNCVSLESIGLPNSLIDVEGEVFKGCSSLSEISIPNKVDRLDHELFEDCISLRRADCTGNIKVIENDVFKNCISLKTVELGKSVTKIGKNAFYGCDELDIVDLPESIVKIGNEAFSKETLLFVHKGSYAEKYAQDNEYCYEDIHRSEAFRLNGLIDESGIDKSEKPKEGYQEKYQLSDNYLFSTLIANPKYAKTRKGRIRNLLFAVLGLILCFILVDGYDRIGNIIEERQYGYIITDDGAYTGESFLGMISGEGTLTLNDGRVYSGEWSNNMPNGRGTLFLSDGTSFDGFFTDGVFSIGNYVATGETSDVSYSIADGKITGYDCKLSDGTKVSVDLTDATAYYSIYYTNGDVYKGDMADGLREGKGKYILADGSTYEGQWINDRIHGVGVLTTKEGVRFSGVFTNNSLYDGTIKFTIDGMSYTYNVNAGRVATDVTIRNSVGDVYSGPIYRNGSTVKGTIKYRNGDVYSGEIKNGLKNGYGEYVWANSQHRYVGNWKDDVMNGKGTYYYGLNERITGTFLNNKPNGTCYYYTNDEIKYITVWKNGIQTSIKKGK